MSVIEKTYSGSGVVITSKLLPVAVTYNGKELKLCRALLNIAQAVIVAGESGIIYDDLLQIMGEGKLYSSNVIRSNVSKINREMRYHGFNGRAIRSKNGIFYWTPKGQ